jgi:hypothetical protein
MRAQPTRYRAFAGVVGLGLLAAATTLVGAPPAARARLPQGDEGIAAQHPGDVGIGKHRDVVFADDFERGTTEEIWKRWWKSQPREEKHARAQALSDDVPAASAGKRSLQMTGTLGQDSGSHLYTVLEPGLETAFVRFYTKFAADHGYEHHFVCLGGYEPALPWPHPRAGTKPAGDDRLLVFIDPIGRYGKHEPPGAWGLYTYWPEMKVSADGGYWGNVISPFKPALVPRGQWLCVELMVRLNAPEERDGELALWIDGKPVLHAHAGVRRSDWSGMGFDLVESGGTEFEGLRLRTSEKLKLNHLWLEHYVDEGAQKANKVAVPNRVNRVWFDDVVVAKSYIGPLASASAGKAGSR